MTGTSIAPNGEPMAIPPAYTVAPDYSPERAALHGRTDISRPTFSQRERNDAARYPIPVTIRHSASCSVDCAVAVRMVSAEKSASDANITRWMPIRSARMPYARVAIP